MTGVRWQSLARTFPGESEEFLLLMFPDIEVEASGVMNRPTAKDPTGATPTLRAEWRMSTPGDVVIRLLVGDDDTMPFLTPEAAATYIIVQWPHLFRRRPR